MSEINPYRGNQTVKAFVKTFTIENPNHYWSQIERITKFVNKLLEAGVKQRDIDVFQANFVHYKDGKQFSKIMFTILYYSYQAIDL